MKYFTGSFFVTIVGLVLSFFVGEYYGGTMAAGFSALLIAVVLGVLEISLSIDNAIVNAAILKEMTALWRHRFLTWGMIIAVFGMRLLFPLLIVMFAAHVNPWEALVMAATKPDDYAKLMLGAHLQVAAFGGAFLMMVALHYFYDGSKTVHWIPFIEKFTAYLGNKIEVIEIAITMGFLLLISHFLAEHQALDFLKAGIVGLMVFIGVDSIGAWLEASDEARKDMHKASAGMFIYLEVLDASFSFDGVVGAFAITHNLFIIMIGLSIGAFFVRSLTIMFVEKEALNKFEYLEHGAFYAIGLLSILMLLDPFLHIPEWFTGLGGGVIIVISFFWSIFARKKENN
jgi:hypothetical protein